MVRPVLPDEGEANWDDELNAGIFSLADTLDGVVARLASLEVRVNSIAPTPVYSVPVAAFTVSQTSGTAPVTVTFTDRSTNTPTGWLWNFGDGSTSTVRNPTHTFSSAGSFTTTLVASNSAGSSSSGPTPTPPSQVITVTAAATAAQPVASFSGTPVTGSAPLSVFFTDTSTNTPTSWLWAFGDGTTSTVKNPAKTYATAGTYTVSLTVANAAGTAPTATQTGYVSVGAATTPTTGLRAAISTSAPMYTNAVSAFPVDTNRTTLKTTSTAALPTNAWFENFMVGSGHQPVQFFPYMAKTTVTGLAFCQAPINTSFPNSVLSTMLESWSFGAGTALNADTAGRVTGFTDLGCTLAWATTSGGGTMTADIVRGMGYVTMRYGTLVPKITTIHGILTINGVAPAGTVTGTKFKFVLNNGQTWILYASSAISLAYAGTTLTGSAAFTGTLRFGILPTGATESVLDSSATAVHTGGTVGWTVSGNTATETFTYTYTGSGAPLNYTLPHHRPRLQNATYPTGFTLTTLRGQVQAVTGNLWTMQIPLPSVSWNNRNPIQSGRLAAIQTALTADASFVPHTNDPYFGGKQIAKAAHLALIADQVGNTTVRDTLVGRLETGVNEYLTKLRYETAWAGIVSVPGLTDQGADFGNGMYNDHHFHYGYTIYAAAVLVKLRPAWNTVSNRAKIHDLIRDFANPTSNDPYFTPMRNWDFYEGHSWAAGHFEFGDNRNSESTSEGVNAYYGIHLWGVATGNDQLTNLGRILMAEEISAAQTYWQVKQAETIYPQPFRQNGVIGIVWSNKVDVATWFGGQYEYILGIQELPTNPTTEVLIRKDWYAEIWPTRVNPLWSRTSVWRAAVINGGSGYVGASNSGAPAFQAYTDGMTAQGGSGTGLQFNCNIAGGAIAEVYIRQPDGRGSGYVDGETVTLNGSGGTGCTVRIWTEPEDGWKGLLLGGHALNNPSEAWTKALELTAYDDGSSKTQLLYFIGTQTG